MIRRSLFEHHQRSCFITPLLTKWLSHLCTSRRLCTFAIMQAKACATTFRVLDVTAHYGLESIHDHKQTHLLKCVAEVKARLASYSAVCVIAVFAVSSEILARACDATGCDAHACWTYVRVLFSRQFHSFCKMIMRHRNPLCPFLSFLFLLIDFVASLPLSCLLVLASILFVCMLLW